MFRSRYIPHNGSFVREAGVGVGDGFGMAATFEQGQVYAGALHLSVGRVAAPSFNPTDGSESTKYRELYWRVYLRNEEAWTGGGGAKLSRALSFTSADWAQAAFAHVWSMGGGGAPNDVSLGLDPAITLCGTDEGGAVVLQIAVEMPTCF